MAIEPGGYDVRFTTPALTDGKWIGVVGSFAVQDGDSETYIAFRRDGTTLHIDVRGGNGSPGDVIETFSLAGVGAVGHDVRVTMHNEFTHVYVDEVWIFSYSYAQIDWSEPKTLALIASSDYGSTPNVTGVRSVELFAWRETIFIEMEQTGSNAINAVIQERPVEILPVHDGGLAISYNSNRAIVEIASDIVRKHSVKESDKSVAGSEAILYFSEISTVRNTDFEAEDGFGTQVYRLTNLDMDAKLAGQTLLDRAQKSQKVHTVHLRPDPRVEIGDIAQVDYTVSGTGTDAGALSGEASGPVAFVVESLRFATSAGRTEMVLTGREI